MTKRILATIFFGFFVFVSNVFAYSPCTGNSVAVPCSYGGYDFNLSWTSGLGDYCYVNTDRANIRQYSVIINPADMQTGYYYSYDSKLYLSEFPYFQNGVFQYYIYSGGTGTLYNGYWSYVPFDPPPQLTVSPDPVAGGGVASSDDVIQCGVNQFNYCQANFPLNSEVELEAYPNTGYAFAYWDDGTSQYTDNPHTFTVSAALGVTAKFIRFLKWPLSGTPWNRTIISEFGDDWLDYCGGQITKHTGIDIAATETETVHAAEGGIVKVAQLDQDWGGWVTIEHNSSSNPYTTTYIHITPSVSVNDVIDK